MGYWKAAGNDGAFKNGQWVREIWPGGGQKGVTKQYFHLEGPGGWLDMFKQSNFKIDHIISPEPRDEAKIYSPEIWELFRESGKRMMIFDAINNK
jgi:hypothetical protein